MNFIMSQKISRESGTNEKKPGPSAKEKRIKGLTNLYYSRKDIQKAIFDFSKNREVIPSYMMESFGKRPDSLQYPGDIFGFAKKGATSFHCSEELWKDSLQLSTEMNESQMSDLRTGWDLLLDIDSKYLDYSKIMAKLILKLLDFHGIKNIGIKFSGSKGFHIIIPWKAFPKEINNVKTSDMFPEYPRIITKYIMNKIKFRLVDEITDTLEEKKYGNLKKYVRKDAQGVIDLSPMNRQIIGVRKKWNKLEEEMDKAKQKSDYTDKVMPDLILVSPRHLFRAPYSLHEKTALASVVLSLEELENFQPKDANPLKVTVRNFLPDSVEGEASELLREALDWHKNQHPEEKINQTSKKSRDFKPVKILNLSDEFLPPSIKKILQGMNDGRKRALFILLNLFRSIGMERDELEKMIYEWNGQNKVPLKTGYIKTQIIWSYRNRIVPPPNYDKDYYKGIGITPTEEELRFKNPVSYIIKKAFQKKSQDRQVRKKRRGRKS